LLDEVYQNTDLISRYPPPTRQAIPTYQKRKRENQPETQRKKITEFRSDRKIVFEEPVNWLKNVHRVDILPLLSLKIEEV
jgi:hypothetical protein